MGYINTTFMLMEPAIGYVRMRWIYSDDTHFIKKYVFARSAYLVLMPVALLTCAIDTIIGVGMALIAICTFGSYQTVVKMVNNHLVSTNYLFNYPYILFLATINPAVKFGDVDHYFLANSIAALKNRTNSLRESKNFLNRHVDFRLTRIFLAFACLLTRTVDGMISLPIVVTSLLTLGQFKTINGLAYKTLKVAGIVHDVFVLTITFINPWAMN